LPFGLEFSPGLGELRLEFVVSPLEALQSEARVFIVLACRKGFHDPDSGRGGRAGNVLQISRSYPEGPALLLRWEQTALNPPPDGSLSHAEPISHLLCAQPEIFCLPQMFLHEEDSRRASG